MLDSQVALLRDRAITAVEYVPSGRRAQLRAQYGHLPEPVWAQIWPGIEAQELRKLREDWVLTQIERHDERAAELRTGKRARTAELEAVERPRASNDEGRYVGTPVLARPPSPACLNGLKAPLRVKRQLYEKRLANTSIEIKRGARPQRVVYTANPMGVRAKPTQRLGLIPFADEAGALPKPDKWRDENYAIPEAKAKDPEYLADRAAFEESVRRSNARLSPFRKKE